MMLRRIFRSLEDINILMFSTILGYLMDFKMSPILLRRLKYWFPQFDRKLHDIVILYNIFCPRHLFFLSDFQHAPFNNRFVRHPYSISIFESIKSLIFDDGSRTGLEIIFEVYVESSSRSFVTQSITAVALLSSPLSHDLLELARWMILYSQSFILCHILCGLSTNPEIHLRSLAHMNCMNFFTSSSVYIYIYILTLSESDAISLVLFCTIQLFSGGFLPTQIYLFVIASTCELHAFRIQASVLLCQDITLSFGISNTERIPNFEIYEL